MGEYDRLEIVTKAGTNNSRLLQLFFVFLSVSIKDNQFKPLIFGLKLLNSSQRVCQLGKKHLK